MATSSSRASPRPDSAKVTHIGPDCGATRYRANCRQPSVLPMRSASASPASESTISRPSVLPVMGAGHLHPTVDAHDLPGLDLHRRAGEQDGRRFDHGRRILRIDGRRRQPQAEPAAVRRLGRQIDRRLHSRRRRAGCIASRRASSCRGPRNRRRRSGSGRTGRPPSRSTSRQWHGSVSKLTAAGTGHRRGEPLDGGVPVGPFDQPQRSHRPLGVYARPPGASPDGELSVARLQALSRAHRATSRPTATGRARGKLAGQRLHRVQLAHGQMALQFGRAASRSAPRGDARRRRSTGRGPRAPARSGRTRPSVTRTPPATRLCRSGCTPLGVSS